MRGPVSLVVRALVVLIAYWRIPKPTLLARSSCSSTTRTPGGSARACATSTKRHFPLVLAAAWKTKPWQLRTWVEPVRDVAILVVVVLAVGASMLNAVPANVWILGLMLMLKGIVFFYLVLWHRFDDRDVRQFSVAVLGVGVFILALAVVEAVDPSAFRGMLNLGSNADAKGQPPGLSSIFVFPVLFSWFMAFVAIFLFAHYVILRRLWMLGGALLFGAAVFLSGRRRAIVGVAVALVGGLVSQVRHGVSRRQVLRLWLPVGAAALVLAIIFAPGLQNLFERSVRVAGSAAAANATAARRTDRVRTAIHDCFSTRRR